ncbi:hypothetical protein [Phormidesmis priestleyi]|nr:hypothetical protein [Phormidesmis priestleyi]
MADCARRSVFAVSPGQRVEVFESATQLPVLEGLTLTLTTEQILSWLVL